MGGAPSTDTAIIRRRVSRSQSQRGTEEPPLIKWTLIAIALAFSLVFLLLPLVNVFAQAFAKGWQAYWNSLTEPDSWAAIRLTLIVAAIAVPLNVMFGVAAAWAIAKFEFRWKSLLTTLIDLPFSVSPVVSGCKATSANGSRRTRSKSSSPCPGSCSQRSLSPFPLWRAN